MPIYPFRPLKMCVSCQFVRDLTHGSRYQVGKISTCHARRITQRTSEFQTSTCRNFVKGIVGRRWVVIACCSWVFRRLYALGIVPAGTLITYAEISIIGRPHNDCSTSAVLLHIIHSFGNESKWQHSLRTAVMRCPLDAICSGIAGY